MIVENQKNIKVHFAASENDSHFCELKAGGIDYMLFTAFALICTKFGITKSSFNKRTLETGPKIYQNSKHCIMDSGLFTLMFGSHKGEKSEDFIERWYNEIVNYVNESGYKGICVEVDCQKVLSAEKAWKFREKMISDLPNNRQINVFHIEDGHKGLDRLIEFSNYIAISVPELRFLGKKNYLESIAHYIKNKKPTIDIHLLGCTELKYLKSLNFCSSADSTSWNSCVRYGFVQLRNGNKGHISSLKKEVYQEYQIKATEYFKIFDAKPTDIKRSGILAFQANEMKLLYQRYAGSQD